MKRNHFTHDEFREFKRIAREGKTAYEALGAATGHEPLKVAETIARTLADEHEEARCQSGHCFGDGLVGDLDADDRAQVKADPIRFGNRCHFCIRAYRAAAAAGRA